MNTEHLILIGLMVYMVVNVVTDIKSRTAYNVWHVIHLVFIFLLIVINELYLHMIVIGIVSISFGFILPKLLRGKIGSGDIKILIVASFYLMILMNDGKWILAVLFFYFVYIATSQIILLGWLIRNDVLKKKEKKYRFPEAIPLFIGLVITLINYY